VCAVNPRSSVGRAPLGGSLPSARDGENVCDRGSRVARVWVSPAPIRAHTRTDLKMVKLDTHHPSPLTPFASRLFFPRVRNSYIL
jgi:hypothetical protein